MTPPENDLRDAVARGWNPRCEMKGARGQCRAPDGCHCREIAALNARALTAETDLAKARADLERVTAERDEAREERDALMRAAGFKPGPFRDALSRQVLLEDVAGRRPAMVEARRAASRNQNDADLWTMRMLDEWPGDTLLIRLWRQRRDATKRADAAEAENTRLKEGMEAAEAEAARFREDLTWIADQMPATCEMTVVHEMADRAHRALSPKEQP